MAPSVQAMGVNEWPAPMHFTRSPRATACSTMPTSSASCVGRRISTGAQDWFPAQLVQLVRSLMLTDRTLRRSGLPGLQGLDELGEDLVDVAHDAEVGHREDRRLGVLVDGDDVLRALHA